MKAKRLSREFPRLTALSRIQLELWQIIALAQQKQAEGDSGKRAFNAGHPVENLLQRPVPHRRRRECHNLPAPRRRLLAPVVRPRRQRYLAPTRSRKCSLSVGRWFVRVSEPEVGLRISRDFIRIIFHRSKTRRRRPSRNDWLQPVVWPFDIRFPLFVTQANSIPAPAAMAKALRGC
jgi:hypothetical protein